ncbi:zinc-binding dehydrogenase [Catelliglobosispora koreensis]|uniref:zinc-binding dehydrogenase n=1 Tax=Catelliglobosispora koreensis TaxID=129052 RepID=UPI000373B935|nr:zinc-binding dehydrogenase [Catelliglobosispora koreensis]
MRAIYASSINPDDPLAGLVVGERPEPQVPEGWTIVQVKASALNHHDLWSLRGVGLSEEQVPMILGCDAAGIDANGNEVVVHAVIGEGEDETLDPKRTLLSEKHPGTLADLVAVPKRNVVPKPAGMSFTDAACFPTAWLTAYRMLVTRGRLPKEGSVLVQGAGGGVATAATVLAHAMGARVYVTSRDADKRERVEALGAQAFESGARLPERVDVVIETVGAATFDHSVKSTKPGGRIVVSGSTSGHQATVDLRRVFFLQQEIIGSTMGTRQELADLLDLVVSTGISPIVDGVYGFTEGRAAFERLNGGDVFGKIVLDHSR